MDTAAHEVLSRWEAFYVIVGSSAGALTGLWFVVITLVGESNIPRRGQTITTLHGAFRDGVAAVVGRLAKNENWLRSVKLERLPGG